MSSSPLSKKRRVSGSEPKTGSNCSSGNAVPSDPRPAPTNGAWLRMGATPTLMRACTPGSWVRAGPRGHETDAKRQRPGVGAAGAGRGDRQEHHPGRGQVCDPARLRTRPVGRPGLPGFYLREDDMGKNRAEASQPRLAELNSYVPVSIHTGALTEDFLSAFQGSWFSPVRPWRSSCGWGSSAMPEASSWWWLTGAGAGEQGPRQLCLGRGRRLEPWAGGAWGCWGGAGSLTFPSTHSQLFCDFGDEMVVTDPNGEQPLSAMVSMVTKGAARGK
uniref:Uncharacterized protein n=1 Tax=Pelodiscus sinensis TaxID=13735 RepID=K7FSJ6_PELSI